MKLMMLRKIGLRGALGELAAPIIFRLHGFPIPQGRNRDLAAGFLGPCNQRGRKHQENGTGAPTVGFHINLAGPPVH